LGHRATIGSARDAALLPLAPLAPDSGTPLCTDTAPRMLVQRSVNPTSTARTWPTASWGNLMSTVNANRIALDIESFGDDDATLVLLAGGRSWTSTSRS
jgi:hypothetical protein